MKMADVEAHPFRLYVHKRDATKEKYLSRTYTLSRSL